MCLKASFSAGSTFLPGSPTFAGLLLWGSLDTGVLVAPLLIVLACRRRDDSFLLADGVCCEHELVLELANLLAERSPLDTSRKSRDLLVLSVEYFETNQGALLCGLTEAWENSMSVTADCLAAGEGLAADWSVREGDFRLEILEGA